MLSQLWYFIFWYQVRGKIPFDPDIIIYLYQNVLLRWQLHAHPGVVWKSWSLLFLRSYRTSSSLSVRPYTHSNRKDRYILSGDFRKFFSSAEIFVVSVDFIAFIDQDTDHPGFEIFRILQCMYFFKAGKYGILYGICGILIIIQDSPCHLVHCQRILFHQFQKCIRISWDGAFYQLYKMLILLA